MGPETEVDVDASPRERHVLANSIGIKDDEPGVPLLCQLLHNTTNAGSIKDEPADAIVSPSASRGRDTGTEIDGDKTPTAPPKGPPSPMSSLQDLPPIRKASPTILASEGLADDSAEKENPDSEDLRRQLDEINEKIASNPIHISGGNTAFLTDLEPELEQEPEPEPEPEPEQEQEPDADADADADPYLDDYDDDFESSIAEELDE